MSSFPSFDAGIPVLTEVFQELPAAAAPAAVDWDALERRLFARVMDTIDTRIEAAIANAMQQAVGDIREGVRAALQEVIANAIKEVEGAGVRSLT
ncbi:hypothetical protein [Massilia sp. PWRC2]|uniref:hypothetical protein n=1 Tax=Massilia sp. PWRC2 TaxID=2804626 RepID=UPI003CF566E0